MDVAEYIGNDKSLAVEDRDSFASDLLASP
jgi:hypothetical protein